MIYRNLLRGTLWTYVKKTVMSCGQIKHRLTAVEGGTIVIIWDDDFKKQFVEV